MLPFALSSEGRACRRASSFDYVVLAELVQQAQDERENTNVGATPRRDKK